MKYAGFRLSLALDHYCIERIKLDFFKHTRIHFTHKKKKHFYGIRQVIRFQSMQTREKEKDAYK